MDEEHLSFSLSICLDSFFGFKRKINYYKKKYFIIIERGKIRKMKSQTKKFHFHSKQHCQHGGKKTVRQVSIKNGKGHKSIVYYDQNKMVAKASEKLKQGEVQLIKVGKFIPGLFKSMKMKSRKSKKSHKKTQKRRKK